ncbi:MAG TPA: transglycosylase SLT domain-containing protein [Blastocatellia bacterium]|nr:transglycosylase SLT domain-containing protein [Blastocatellia bacterium]
MMNALGRKTGHLPPALGEEKKSRWLHLGRLTTLVLVLAMVSFSPPFQADEKRAEAELRTLMSRSSSVSDAALMALEKKYPETTAAGLALFLRGYRKYQVGQYGEAAALLTHPLIARKTRLADYALMYAARSWAEAGRLLEAEKLFVRLWQQHPNSIHARPALDQAARLAMERNDWRTAISYLDPVASAGDVGALLTQARCYEHLGEVRKARALYERVHFDLPPTKESPVARDRLRALGVNVDDLSRYSWERARGRADRLYQAKAYTEAVTAYRQLLKYFPQAAGDDLIALRLGVSLYETGRLREALHVLRQVSRQSADRESEALYYASECWKRLGNEAEFLATSRRLVQQYPQSPWAARTLYSRGLYFLKADRVEDSLDALRQLLTLHPTAPEAPEASWRVGWIAYRRGEYSRAAGQLLEHVARYPRSEYLVQAAYWAARAEEHLGRRERARALYNRVIERSPYSYYGLRASERLKSLGRGSSMAASGFSSDVSSDARSRYSFSGHASAAPLGPRDDTFPRALTHLERVTPPAETATPAALERVERAIQLRWLQLDDLALSELEAAQRESPNSHRVNVEIARIYRDHANYLAAINAVRRAHPDYLSYQGNELPEEVFQLLFPLTHWNLIRENCRRHGLDPYLVAGLIRQESGFLVRARSVANARGLMQIIPSTGRLVARRYGLRRFRPDQLYDPALNIRLGTAYLADMIQRFGRIEYALAAYNAGPLRVARWMRELPSGDIDEWVESIPITETRLYVQAVLRNKAHYQRIYR